MTTYTTADLKEAAEAQVQSFITRGVQKSMLSNGLTVLTKELHDKPLVAAIIWYRVGSRNEELGQTGKSHFLEHMLFKGTDRFKKGHIDLITLKNGGSNNAFTWMDFTAYYFAFASDRWEIALEIEANRMRNTLFDQEEFEAEKQVVEEELRIGLDGPWEALDNEVWAAAFRQHPYHWPTVGWLDDLESATAADMKAYYDQWYHPNNATLALVGDFNTEQVLAKVEAIFGSIPAGPEAKPLGIKEPEQKGEKRVIVKKETPVERLLIAYHAPAVGEADSYALHVVETILSMGKTSRLYRRLVDQDQSVTIAKANYNDHVDPSLFYIQAEVKPGFSLKEVELAIYDEIDRLKREEVPASELEKARRQIEADLVLSSEEYLQQAILLGQYETIAAAERIPAESRGYKFLETMLDRIREVTAEDVRRVAQKYLAQDNRTVGYLIDEKSNAFGSAGGSAGALNLSPDAPRRGSASKTGARQSQADSAGPVGWGGRASASAAFRSGAGQDVAEGASASEAVDVETHSQGARAEAESVEQAESSEQASGLRLKLDVERVELDNGLVLLLSENHASPSVAFNAAVMVGSRLEPDEKAGLASLVGELLDEGTRTQTSQQIAESVEAVGARLQTFGDYQSSGVQAVFLSKDASLGINVIADVLMNATFPEDKVKQHVERRLAQIKSRLDVPRVQASDIFNEIIFKGHPQHRPSVGTEESVRNLTRDDIVSFYERFYAPGNTVMSIVGDIDKADIKHRVAEAFGGWTRSEDFKAAAPPHPARQTEAIEKYVTAPKEQVNIYIGHIGIERRNHDYYALRVLDTILGSSPGFTSRIPRILREEQGLAYTTYSNITSSAGIDPGRFIAYIGTSPDNLYQALAGLRGEIARIVREPVTAEEIEGAKEYLTGSFVFEFQTNSQVADFLVEAEMYDLGFDYLEKYPELIRAVTIEELTRVAHKYLDPESLTTVVVGPVDSQGRVIKKENEKQKTSVQ
jgi:zinc protease